MAFSDRPQPAGGGPGPAPGRVTGPGKHAKAHRWTWMMAAALVAAAAVAVVSVLLARQAGAPAAGPGPAPAGGVPAAAASNARQVTQRADAAIASCRAAWNAQSPALAAADRSLAQWQVHVDAMNALVSGKITFPQASRFWARTRVGAAHRVHVFDRAYRALQHSDPTCATPTGVRVSGSRAATLRACVQGVRVRNQTLASARTAIATWRGHIDEMEMLRNGKLSPNMATRMWIRSWHRGQRQLDDYRTLNSQASAQHC